MKKQNRNLRTADRPIVPHIIADFNACAVFIHNFLDGGQSQAGAFGLARDIRLKSAQADAPENLGRCRKCSGARPEERVPTDSSRRLTVPASPFESRSTPISGAAVRLHPAHSAINYESPAAVGLDRRA